MYLYIVILLLLFLIPRILITYKKWMKYMTGEDLYQKEKGKITHNSYIYSYQKISDVSPKHDKFGTSGQVKSLISTYKSYCKIHGFDYESTFSSVDVGGISLFRDSFDEYYPKNGEYLKVVYSTKSFLLYLDHSYLGSGVFNEIGATMTGSDKVVLATPPPFPFRDMLSWKFIIYDYIFKTNSHVALPVTKSPLKRHVNKDNVKTITQKNPGVSGLHSVIYDALDRVRSSLKTKRDIKCYITYGFDHEPGLYNNIGIIFLDFDKDATVKDISKQINDKKYQVVATNYLMKAMDKGKSVRNSVDCVFSIGNLTGGIMGEEVDEFMFTFGTKPDYPIYVASITLDGYRHLTITSNTDELDMEALTSYTL